MRQIVTYPLLGLLSLAIGVAIVDSGLNVHSGEIFLWLIAVFGFILLAPLVLLAKSIQILIIKMKTEVSRKKTSMRILTILLGLSWATTVTIGLLKSL